jgi:CheY-like chemotaxis protein
VKKSQTICIIDDDDIYLFLSKKTIHRFNADIQISTYGNGEDAINAFRKMILSNETLPDIILLDINMPIMDGWQFMDNYKQLNSQISHNISVYISSSSLDPADIERSKKHTEVKGFLHKPLDNETLMQICQTDGRSEF